VSTVPVRRRTASLGLAPHRTLFRSKPRCQSSAVSVGTVGILWVLWVLWVLRYTVSTAARVRARRFLALNRLSYHPPARAPACVCVCVIGWGCPAGLAGCSRSATTTSTRPTTPPACCRRRPAAPLHRCTRCTPYADGRWRVAVSLTPRGCSAAQTNTHTHTHTHTHTGWGWCGRSACAIGRAVL
jgi:hypothetical protein